jgi:ferrous iron transport protein B
LVISEARRRSALRLAEACLTQEPVTHRRRLSWLGTLSMHPIWGVLVFLGVLAAMYVLVGDWAAQRMVNWLETELFGRFVIPAAVQAVQAVVPWRWLQALLVGEYGVLTMALPYAFAIILPIVGMFFLCFGLLEDVGYLPRLAIMAHRGCRLLGLNGKAVLPLLLGLGCGTMATMSTRILETRRDRILATLLLALGVPCSAQLGVVLAMLAGQPLGLAIWAGVILAVLMVVGRLAAALLPGEESPFLYELPPLRWPKLSNVVLKTLGRVEWYVREAVPLFFLGTLALYLVDCAGWLAQIERALQPLVTGWLGMPGKATEAFLIGFLRRDFGAAGLYTLQRQGLLSPAQTVASLVTITLFVPCIAQYFMMVKERGWRTAAVIAGLSVTLAFVMGGVVLRGLNAWGGLG